MKKHSKTLSDCWTFDSESNNFSTLVNLGQDFCYRDDDGEFKSNITISIPYFPLRTILQNSDPSSLLAEEVDSFQRCFSRLADMVSFDTFETTDEILPNNVCLIEVWPRYYQSEWKFKGSSTRTVCIWKIANDEICIIDPIDSNDTIFLQGFIHSEFHQWSNIVLYNGRKGRKFYHISENSRDNVDIAVKIALCINITQTQYHLYDKNDFSSSQKNFPKSKRFYQIIDYQKTLSNQCTINRRIGPYDATNFKDLQTTDTIQRENINEMIETNYCAFYLLEASGIDLTFSSLKKCNHLHYSWANNHRVVTEFHHEKTTNQQKDALVYLFKEEFLKPCDYQIEEFAKECVTLFQMNDRTLLSLLLQVEIRDKRYFIITANYDKTAFFIFVVSSLGWGRHKFQSDEELCLFNEACAIFIRNMTFETLVLRDTERGGSTIMELLLRHPKSSWVIDYLLTKFPKIATHIETYGHPLRKFFDKKR